MPEILIGDATFYKYKAKFGGIDVSDTKKLAAFEDENNRLKRILADAILDNDALKNLATKTTDARCPKAGLFGHDGPAWPFRTLAGQLVNLHRLVFRSKKQDQGDEALSYPLG